MSSWTRRSATGFYALSLKTKTPAEAGAAEEHVPALVIRTLEIFY